MDKRDPREAPGKKGSESDGAAYPNPHTGKEGKAAPTHGGQTEPAYHGSGRLGERKAGDGPDNGVAEHDG